jgi:hypothetical protein
VEARKEPSAGECEGAVGREEGEDQALSMKEPKVDEWEASQALAAESSWRAKRGERSEHKGRFGVGGWVGG